MPSTPIYALPYPAASDPADVPLDMQELADRTEAVLPTLAGTQLAYVELTTTITVGTTGILVLATGAVTYAAQPIHIEFFAPLVDKGAGALMNIFLYDGGTALGVIGYLGAAGAMPIQVARKLTPSAGSHNYQIQANVASGSGGIQGSTGIGSALVPGYLRVTRA